MPVATLATQIREEIEEWWEAQVQYGPAPTEKVLRKREADLTETALLKIRCHELWAQADPRPTSPDFSEPGAIPGPSEGFDVYHPKR
jgi:hypothetical protein